MYHTGPHQIRVLISQLKSLAYLSMTMYT